jgi:hypothetical protein
MLCGKLVLYHILISEDFIVIIHHISDYYVLNNTNFCIRDPSESALQMSAPQKRSGGFPLTSTRYGALAYIFIYNTISPTGYSSFINLFDLENITPLRG